MTTTLLTHEWLRTRSALGAFFGIVALVVVLGSLLGVTDWPLLAVLGYLLAGFGVFALVPATQLILAADYWRSGYGRTGYFTHSIPARGSTIYRAKLLWSVIASAAALVLTVLLGLVFWWAVARNTGVPAPSWSVVSDMLTAVSDALPAWLIVVGLVVGLAAVLLTPVYYYFSVSLGLEARFAGLGVGGPIVVFVVLYIVVQLLSLLGMVVLPFGIGPAGDQTVGFVSFNLVTEMSKGAQGNSDVLPIGFVVAMAALTVYCIWRTARSWNRHVSLS